MDWSCGWLIHASISFLMPLLLAIIMERGEAGDIDEVM
jgi:hypothetical protein